MKRTAIVAFTFLVTGCGSGEAPVEKQDKKEDKLAASEDSFSKIVSQYFEKHGDQCLGTFSFPEKVDGFNPLLKDFESVGFIKEEENPSPSDPNVKSKVYVVTEEGKKHAIQFRSESQGEVTSFCWGKKKLTNVIKWDGPLKLGDYQEAKIYFSYQLVIESDWIKNPLFRIAVSMSGFDLNKEDKIYESSLSVKATSNGWETLSKPPLQKM